MPEEKHVGTGRTNCTSQRPKGIHLLQESRSQRTRDRRYLVGVCIYIRCLRIEPRPAFIDSFGAQRSSPCARQRHCRNSRLILPSKSAHSPMLIDVNFFRVVLYHLSVRSSEGSQRWHEKSGNCRQYNTDLVIAKVDPRITTNLKYRDRLRSEPNASMELHVSLPNGDSRKDHSDTLMSDSKDHLEKSKAHMF